MKIDFRYVLKQFQNYRAQYPNTERINLKEAHMRRVMKNNVRLAQTLGLSMNDVCLAAVIGLLHDIGRFEQVRRFDTFIDKDSVDHAMLSSEILFQDGLIRKFVPDNSYDNIIQKAIENHSRFEIEDGLSKTEKLHAMLVRDSDKVDIYPQVLISDPNLVFDGPYHQSDRVSEKVVHDFMEGRCVRTEDMRCKADDFVRKVALIYGLYFPESLSQIKRQDSITRLFHQFKEAFPFDDERTNQMLEMVTNIANSYMNKQVKQEDKEQQL